MRLAYIQVLRFLAATAVVIFHGLGTDASYVKTQGSSLFWPFAHGDLGVDLFFVISGFVIYLSAAKPDITASNFLVRRLERIIPIYWVVTLGMAALLVFVPGAFKGGFGPDIGLIVRSLFFLSFTTNSFPIVFPGWSLEYEMFFYLTVTVLLFAMRRATWDLVTVLFALLVAAGLLFDVGKLDVFNLLGFATRPMVVEFVFGITVARLFRGDRIPTAVVAVLVGVVAVLLVVDPTNRAVVAGLPAAALVFGAAWLSTRASDQSPLLAVLKRLGDASYSVYLIQNLVISATDKIVVKVMPSIDLDVLIVITTVTTIASGYLVYLCIERPLLWAMRAWNPLLVSTRRNRQTGLGNSPTSGQRQT